MTLGDLALPLIRMLDPERAHRLSIRLLASGLPVGTADAPDPRLACEVFGLRFANPIGLAAGFDKDAEAVLPCLNLGFGFVEIGTVTPRPQTGNPRPRLFRLSRDRAVINRMGFNNAGMDAAAMRLTTVRTGALPGPVGVNIGKNKETEDAAADYAACAARLAPLADYLTVNVSSPNTPGLRALQSADSLVDLVGAVRIAAGPSAPPILVKIAPDLADDDLAAIADAARKSAVSGLIVSNTTVARPDRLTDPQRTQSGGLSGQPLMAPSTDILRKVYAQTAGGIPLIGVGGVASAADAYAKIRAGASLVQLYSSLVFEGPGLVKRITRDLPALLERDGFASISDAVGADH